MDIGNLKPGENIEIDKILEQIGSLSQEAQKEIFAKLQEKEESKSTESTKEYIFNALSPNINNIITEYTDMLKKANEDPNLLERISIIANAINLANKIAKENNTKAYQIDIDRFKKETSEIILLRIFESAIKKNKTSEEFEETMEDTKKRIKEYNEKNHNKIGELILNKKDTYKLLKENIEKSSIANKFTENMFKYFTEDFRETIENARYGRDFVKEEDQAKILELATTIALYTTDFSEFFTKYDDIHYYKNLQLLIAGLDYDKVKGKKFDENDIEKCNRASLAIIKILRNIGVKELNALAGGYRIFPEDIKKTPL